MSITKAIEIRKTHRLGNGKQRPVKVVLANASDKGTIYTNAKNLQGKTNKFNKGYRLEDELPPSMRQARKKARDFAWRNKKSVADQLALSVKKGKLLCNDVPYLNQIVKPNAQELMKLKTDEIMELDKHSTNMSMGTPVEHGTSVFTGYVCNASNIQDVNKGYEWVKFHNMDARHIICCCKIPSTEETLGFEYEDDDEHGAGQVLLEFMEKADIDNRAIYVTRHYDGQHIGQVRFDGIVDAAKSATNQRPFNAISKRFQFSWPNPKSGRGGYNNMGQRLRHVSELSDTPSAKSTNLPSDDEEDQEIEFGSNTNKWNEVQNPIQDWANASQPNMNDLPTAPPFNASEAMSVSHK